MSIQYHKVPDDNRSIPSRHSPVNHWRYTVERLTTVIQRWNINLDSAVKYHPWFSSGFPPVIPKWNQNQNSTKWWIYSIWVQFNFVYYFWEKLHAKKNLLKTGDNCSLNTSRRFNSLDKVHMSSHQPFLTDR